MSTDTRARLRRLNRLGRLGLKKGAAHVPQPPPKPRPTDIPLPDSPLPLHFLEYQFDEHNPAHSMPILKQTVTGATTLKSKRGEAGDVAPLLLARHAARKSL